MISIYTAEDIQLTSELDGRTLYVFGLHTGEPGEREIYHRKVYRANHGKNELAISKVCPCCEGKDTEWVREDGDTSWSVCYRCEIAFEDEVYYDLTECEE